MTNLERAFLYLLLADFFFDAAGPDDQALDVLLSTILGLLCFALMLWQWVREYRSQ